MSLQPPQRSAKDYLLPLLIIVALGAVVILSFRLWGILRGAEEGPSDFAMAGKVALTVERGSVEAYLPASSAWKIIEEQALLGAGEKVRTGTASAATLTFDDGAKLTLDSGTEVNLDDLKNTILSKSAAITLTRGSIWLETTNPRSAFTLAAPLLKASDLEGKILLTTTAAARPLDISTADADINQTTVHNTDLTVVSGALAATVLDPQNTKNPELKRLAVEAGKTLSVSERRINLLRIGGTLELVAPTPAEILASNFYLKMAGGITPSVSIAEEAVSGTALIEQPTTSEKTIEAAVPVISSATLSAPVVTSFSGQALTTSADNLTVVGTVTAAATKVEVTNAGIAYELKKFVAGSGKWNYRVGTALGNLQPGTNTYSVVATDAEGIRSPATTFTITYTPEKTTTTTAEKTTETTLPQTTTKATASPSTEVFGAPTVTTPTNGATYTTAPIRFTGSVPAGTASVEVNGYALTQGFTTGSTTWWYQAAPAYGNLTAGENEYEITAVSATGAKSSVTVKITYEPPATTTEVPTPPGANY